MTKTFLKKWVLVYEKNLQREDIAACNMASQKSKIIFFSVRFKKGLEDTT